MIKFAATNNETGLPVLGIGLSRENCDRLLSGQPIIFETKGMIDTPHIEVFIMAGETEESITKVMIDSGALKRDQIYEDTALRSAQSPKGVN